MDGLTFTAKVVEAVAWPLVALILGLMFRRRILDLIPALKKFKAGPVEAEFELAAKQVLANAAEAALQNQPSAATDSAKWTDDGKGDLVTRVLNARSDPARMILEGWAAVDGELFRLGQQLGFVDDPLTSTTKVYEKVMASKVLPIGTVRLVQQVRDLRNDVAHAKVTPTSDAATDYLLAVDRVVELIRNYRKNLSNYGPATR